MDSFPVSKYFIFLSHAFVFAVPWNNMLALAPFSFKFQSKRSSVKEIFIFLVINVLS